MDPTVSVKHIFWNILRVDTIDGIAHILPGRHDETKGHQNEHRDGIVQTKNGRIGVDVVDSDEGLESAEDVQHFPTINEAELCAAADGSPSSMCLSHTRAQVRLSRRRRRRPGVETLILTLTCPTERPCAGRVASYDYLTSESYK
ncbi:hypothetical protein TcasGA2_TC011415 [Tribolium castaneum]|uniref:Uncharacterized protein n=1 Tax=Tribolium castaneum TaxID=7070 RepID=D6X4I3_TRICA|nr:hypothetical protein TcasGA2_TC011415 [Tribolium castaneum]